MELVKPEVYATLQVIGVQNLVGRKHPHVRVFGVREHNPAGRVYEIALNMDDAVELIEYATAHKVFPQIEVNERSLIFPATTKGIDIVYMKGTQEAP